MDLRLSGEERWTITIHRKYVTRNNGVPLLEKDLTDQIIAAAIEVLKALGPGLLESAYQLCMAHESTFIKLPFEQQIPLKVKFKGLELEREISKNGDASPFFGLL